jgi:hypothetical protein
MFVKVSFGLPARCPIEIISMGGAVDTALKKLNGARLLVPSGATELTHAIGRGITIPSMSCDSDRGG